MSVEEARWATPDLQSLVDLFYQQPDRLGQFEEVSGDQVPEPYGQLLNHHAHMTVTVEQFHGCSVNVEVVDLHETATHYSRRILLKRETDNKVVQFGIVRLNLSVLEPTVQERIRSQSAPLGRILIEHQVLRNVKLMSLWKVNPGPDLQRYFEQPEMSICYGRTALIYCNNLPAVELLEIVCD